MKALKAEHKARGTRFLLRVETSHNSADYQKYEDLRNAIWEEPRDRMPGPRNMVCENFFNDGSALFIGAFVQDSSGGFPQDRDHLVGFSYGFVGVRDKSIGFRALDNLLFYSQYTGVREDFQGYGLGDRIKEFQGQVLQEVFGIHTIFCTYDPLTSVNAYRNIHRFGMEVSAYNVDHYGEFGGRLNRVDIPCDRFCVLWDLRRTSERPDDDPKALTGLGSWAVQAKLEEIQGKTGSVVLEVVAEIDLDLDQEFVLVEIPYDFYRMLQETDVADERVRCVPLDWRQATREVFQAYLARGYRVVGFRTSEEEGRTRGFYVLKK